MTEGELIVKLAKLMPRTDLQENELFESDSEILNFASKKMLFTTDEFSGEDMFSEKDPYILGHNIAVGAISDIYASGGVPMFYAHSLTVNELFNENFLVKFYKGVSDILKTAGVGFIGGDFGRAGEWRCCTSVIGVSEMPILRSGAKAGDSIYITGKVGSGNLQAAAKIYNIDTVKIKFSLRKDEAELIRQHATSCIDTSDGVFNAVNTISNMSSTGFELFNIPYIKAGTMMAKLLGLPKEMLFLCECGEYELLFTSAPDVDLPFYKIGRITESGKLLNNKDISKINISAREFKEMSGYMKVVKKLCEELL